MFTQCLDPLQCRYGTQWDGSSWDGLNGNPVGPYQFVYGDGTTRDETGSYKLDHPDKAYNIMLRTKIYQCEFSYNVHGGFDDYGNQIYYTGSGSFPMIVGNIQANNISNLVHSKLGSLAAFDYGGDCNNYDINVDLSAIYLMPPYDPWGLNEESGQVCYTGINGKIFLPPYDPLDCGQQTGYYYHGSFINTLESSDNTHNYIVANGDSKSLGQYFSLSVPQPNQQSNVPSYTASASINVFHDSSGNFYYQTGFRIDHLGGMAQFPTSGGGIVFFKPDPSAPNALNAYEITNAITSNFHWNGNKYSISQSAWAYGFGYSQVGYDPNTGIINVPVDLSGSTCSVTITPVEYWTYGSPSDYPDPNTGEKPKILFYNSVSGDSISGT